MKAVILLSLLLVTTFLSAQKVKKEVPQAAMQQIYEEVKTPYKWGLVVVPSSDAQKIDCPSVFRKGDMWYMTYLLFNGTGYETWLAESRDLLHWKTNGRLLSHASDTTAWDARQRAGYIALQDTRWEGSYALERYKGKYWMSYIGGNEKGYEAGLLSLGMAYSTADPATVHEWQRLPQPILASNDPDVRWWENKKQFKSTVIHDGGKLTGYPFVMYYNANGDSAKNNIKTRWFERIGMAVSTDMVHWKRFHQEPVVHHPVGITGDPVIQKIGPVWVMFYFGAFWQDRKGAFNRFACSYDLVNWTDWNGENLIQSSESYDDLYAHKSYVVKYKGVVYHFYCAVNKGEQRGIAVATSKDMGKSSLEFVNSPAGGQK
ncbi:MAG: glycosylase [Williamsia sp.]|nr:glycosylase [Williamsia sp.]